MFLKKKALLATALTSASFVGAMLPGATWAAPNVTEECAPGTQIESTQCGLNSHAQAPDSTAIGESAVVEPDAENGTAIGANSIVKNIGGTAIGVDSKAEGTNSVAIGLNASVDQLLGGANPGEATGGIAIGHNSRVGSTGDDAIALGRGARSDGIGSISIGATASAGIEKTVAIGFNARTLLGSKNGIALGVNASVSAENAVAIGLDSEANLANTVSFGNGFANRRLVNLNDALDPTDATTLRQVQALVATGSSLIKINVAAGAAAPVLGTNSIGIGGGIDAPGNNNLAIGNSARISMSFNHRLNLDIPMAIGGGIAHSGGKDTVVRAHVATEF